MQNPVDIPLPHFSEKFLLFVLDEKYKDNTKIEMRDNEIPGDYYPIIKKILSDLKEYGYISNFNTYPLGADNPSSIDFDLTTKGVSYKFDQFKGIPTVNTANRIKNLNIKDWNEIKYLLFITIALIIFNYLVNNPNLQENNDGFSSPTSFSSQQSESLAYITPSPTQTLNPIPELPTPMPTFPSSPSSIPPTLTSTPTTTPTPTPTPIPLPPYFISKDQFDKSTWLLENSSGYLFVAEEDIGSDSRDFYNDFGFYNQIRSDFDPRDGLRISLNVSSSNQEIISRKSSGVRAITYDLQGQDIFDVTLQIDLDALESRSSCIISPNSCIANLFIGFGHPSGIAFDETNGFFLFIKYLFDEDEHGNFWQYCIAPNYSTRCLERYLIPFEFLRESNPNNSINPDQIIVRFTKNVSDYDITIMNGGQVFSKHHPSGLQDIFWIGTHSFHNDALFEAFIEFIPSDN